MCGDYLCNSAMPLKAMVVALTHLVGYILWKDICQMTQFAVLFL